MSTHQLLFLHPPPTKQPGSLAGVGREGAVVQVPPLAWGQVSRLACSIRDKALRERIGTWTDRWPQIQVSRDNVRKTRVRCSHWVSLTFAPDLPRYH